MNIKEILRKLKKIYIYFTSTHAYYKGIKLSDSHCEYLAHFIADRMNADCERNKIALFSASSLPEILRLERTPIKIFYTIENVHVFESYWERWENLHLQKYAPALSVVFDYCDHPRYVRFPYWLERPLGAYATKEGIAKFVREHNYSNFTNRTKACAFICRGFPVEDYPMQAILSQHTLWGHINDLCVVYRVYKESATFISFDHPKYLQYYRGLADIRRYLNELFPADVCFSEEQIQEQLFYKEFLLYLHQLEYRKAKELINESTTTADSGKVKQAKRFTRTWLHFVAAHIIKEYNYKKI